MVPEGHFMPVVPSAASRFQQVRRIAVDNGVRRQLRRPQPRDGIALDKLHRSIDPLAFHRDRRSPRAFIAGQRDAGRLARQREGARFTVHENRPRCQSLLAKYYTGPAKRFDVHRVWRNLIDDPLPDPHSSLRTGVLHRILHRGKQLRRWPSSRPNAMMSSNNPPKPPNSTGSCPTAQARRLCRSRTASVRYAVGRQAVKDRQYPVGLGRRERLPKAAFDGRRRRGPIQRPSSRRRGHVAGETPSRRRLGRPAEPDAAGFEHRINRERVDAGECFRHVRTHSPNPPTHRGCALDGLRNSPATDKSPDVLGHRAEGNQRRQPVRARQPLLPLTTPQAFRHSRRGHRSERDRSQSTWLHLLGLGRQGNSPCRRRIGVSESNQRWAGVG